MGGETFRATLADNETAQALAGRLPVTLDMSELNGNEKYAALSEVLPTDASCPGEIHTGDLMLYGDDCLVLFYQDFSTGYSYTRLGALDDPAGLSDAVGTGGVTVTISKD